MFRKLCKTPAYMREETIFMFRWKKVNTFPENKIRKKCIGAKWIKRKGVIALTILIALKTTYNLDIKISPNIFIWFNAAEAK